MTTRVALLCGLLLPAAGCGEPGRPAKVPVTGKVMFKKTTPAAGALVVFHPAEAETERQIGGKPFARVREDGSFALTTHEQDDGAPPGEYGVTVDWRKAAPKAAGKLSLGGDGGEGAPAGVSALSPKYGNPAKPAFTFTVKAGEKNEFLIEVD